MGASLGQAVDSMQQSGSLMDQMRDSAGGVWQATRATRSASTSTASWPPTCRTRTPR